MICLWSALSLQRFALSNEPGGPHWWHTPRTLMLGGLLVEKPVVLSQSSAFRPQGGGAVIRAVRACKGHREGRSPRGGECKNKQTKNLEARFQTSFCMVYLHYLIYDTVRLPLFKKWDLWLNARESRKWPEWPCSRDSSTDPCASYKEDGQSKRIEWHLVTFSLFWFHFCFTFFF